MKILLINDDLRKKAGAEVQVYQERNWLLRNTHEVRIAGFGPAPEGEEGVSAIRESSHLFLQKLSKLFLDPVKYLKLREKIKSFDPDVIHIHRNAKYPATVLLACRGYPVVKTAHDFYMICPTGWAVFQDSLEPCPGGAGIKCVRHRCKSPAELFFYQWPLFLVKEWLQKKLVSEFVAPSEVLTDFLAESGYSARHLPNPVELDSWARENGTAGSGPASGDSPMVLFVGSLKPNKGVKYLIRATKKVLEDYPEVRLLLAGDGPRRDGLEKQVNDLDIQDHVNFLGFIPHEEVTELYRRATVTVVPSIWRENFPTVVLESFSAGTPVIGSDRGGIPELLAEGRGIVYSPKDSDSLGKAICRLLGDEGLRRKFSRNGRRFVEEKLDEDEIYNELEGVLGRVAKS